MGVESTEKSVTLADVPRGHRLIFFTIKFIQFRSKCINVNENYNNFSYSQTFRNLLNFALDKQTPKMGNKNKYKKVVLL